MVCPEYRGILDVCATIESSGSRVKHGMTKKWARDDEAGAGWSEQPLAIETVLTGIKGFAYGFADKGDHHQHQG